MRAPLVDHHVHGDALSPELGGDGLRDVLVERVPARGRVEGEDQRLRIDAGFLEEGLGLLGIVLEALDLGEVVDVDGRKRPAHLARAPPEHVLDELVHVDRLRDGLAHLQVLHRPLLEVDEGQVVDARGDGGPHGRLAAGIDEVHRVRRHVLHDVDLAGEKRGEARRELGDEAEGDLLDLGLALPVVVVARDDQLLVAYPLRELEGPRARGLGGQSLDALLEGLGRHRHEILQGDAVDEPRPWLVGDEAYRVGIDDLDFLHQCPARQVVRLVGGVLDVVHGRLDALGIEGLAVVELDALAQGELPRGVVHHLPRDGEHGDRLVALRIAVDQPIVHVLDHVVGRPVHDGVGQERPGLCREGHDDFLGLHSILGKDRGGRGQEGKHGCEDFQELHERILLVR